MLHILHNKYQIKHILDILKFQYFFFSVPISIIYFTIMYHLQLKPLKPAIKALIGCRVTLGVVSVSVIQLIGW